VTFRCNPPPLSAAGSLFRSCIHSEPTKFRQLPWKTGKTSAFTHDSTRARSRRAPSMRSFCPSLSRRMPIAIYGDPLTSLPRSRNLIVIRPRVAGHVRDGSSGRSIARRCCRDLRRRFARSRASTRSTPDPFGSRLIPRLHRRSTHLPIHPSLVPNTTNSLPPTASCDTLASIAPVAPRRRRIRAAAVDSNSSMQEH